MATKQLFKKPLTNRNTLLTILLVLACIGIFLYSLPLLFIWKEQFLLAQPIKPDFFPVTVNPQQKIIAEDPAVDAMLDNENSTLSAAVENASEALDLLASAIASTPLYQMLAATDARLVVINPGYRKEQAANVFAKALRWSDPVQKLFLDPVGALSLSEGHVSPGTYVVGLGATADMTRATIEERFKRDILSHYGTSTEAVVPLSQGLTIASMLERETNDRNEMRLISGIMWNRMFTGMKLQIDATLQYAKASNAPAKTNKNWWPLLSSKDKYIESPFNTYQNVGLPPAPISNPSVAAVLAALNPKKTSCLFYFHDSHGGFHCSETYKGHVTLLKKYYGHGK